MTWRSDGGRKASAALWQAPEQHTGELKRVPEGATWRDLMATLSELEGSDVALSRRIGYADGSRVSEWRRGTPRRPSVRLCALIGVLYNYDPLDILQLGGHGDLSDLLARRLGGAYAERERVREAIAVQQLKRMKNLIIEAWGLVEKVV